MRRLLGTTLAGVLVLGCVAATRAADKEAIQRAVDRGVQALKAHGGAGRELGLSALCGLALLECGVPADDPTMQAIITRVRSESISTNHTYSIALSIMFFDRLGDRGDIPLIESLAVRLLAGQNRSGGWTYDCPTIGQAEIQRLSTDVARRTQLIGRVRPPVLGDRPGDKTPERTADKPVRRTVADLPQEIKAQLEQINLKGLQPEAGGDNSNTQFATLGLWVARKYGLPVDNSLARVDARFRLSQNADGGWGYSSGHHNKDSSTATMTCAGVLALAVGHGLAAARAQEKDPKAHPANLRGDRNLQAGLIVLTALVDHPIANKFKGKGPRPKWGRIDGKSYYFLFGLERLAVALGLDTIGGKDWYTWGSEVLIDNQEADGNWVGNYAVADTCFALLFLKRANLAKDLTTALRGKIQDPAEVVLKAGGVGGDSLRVPSNIKSGLETEKTKNPGPGPNHTGKKPDPLKDPGSSKKPAELSPSDKLAQELVRSEKPRQERTLEQLRDGKGVIYTEALARAIPQLEDAHLRGKARRALIERLSRLKDQSLRVYLKDEDVELRRAAALAADLKDARELVPDLIALLSDREELVKRAAHSALQSLTGQKFGPGPQEWQNWWNRQKK